MKRHTKEAKMNLAIQARKRNPKLTFKKLRSIYKVPEFALKARYYVGYARTDNGPNSRKLTPTEKEFTIDKIINLNTRTFPIRLQHIKDIANLLLA